MAGIQFSTALIVIARNEERCIQRCLASAKPHVDEIVLLDTGSTDRTIEIAREMQARVINFQWIDDFAAARNAALDATDATWRIVLDADEWLDDTGSLLHDLRTTEPNFVGALNVCSLLDADVNTGLPLQTSDWLSRVLPPRVRYTGRIHENPVHALSVRRLPITVWHDGYVKAQRARKQGRNLALLERAVAEQPGDAYFRYQLAREQEQVGDLTAAAASYREALREQSTTTPPWHNSAVCNAIYFFGKSRLFAEGVELVQIELPRCEESTDFWFVLGGFFLELITDDPALAPEFLPRIEECYLRCLELGEQPKVTGSMRGRGSFLAARNLYALYAATGDAERAEKYRLQSMITDNF